MSETSGDIAMNERDGGGLGHDQAANVQVQNPCFEKARKSLSEVELALESGFSTQSKRKELNQGLSRAYASVADLANEHSRVGHKVRASEDSWGHYWDNSFPISDLHNVRPKHFAYALAAGADIEPALAVIRELKAMRDKLSLYVLAPKLLAKKHRSVMPGEAFKMQGICPCCGLDYAVLERTGCMSKHGYKVDKQWGFGQFNGVCDGEKFKPVEVCRVAADSTVQGHLSAAQRCDEVADALRGGKVFPKHLTRVVGREKQLVKYAEGTERERRIALAEAIARSEYEAREHRRFAEFMSKQIEFFHGKPLRKALV